MEEKGGGCPKWGVFIGDHKTLQTFAEDLAETLHKTFVYTVQKTL